jgi:SAM-dependent methyltransferase
MSRLPFALLALLPQFQAQCWHFKFHANAPHLSALMNAAGGDEVRAMVAFACARKLASPDQIEGFAWALSLRDALKQLQKLPPQGAAHAWHWAQLQRALNGYTAWSHQAHKLKEFHVPPSVRAVLQLRNIRLQDLTPTVARDVLADTAAIGPHALLNELAVYLLSAYPEWRGARHQPLEDELQHLAAGGPKAPIPATLKAHIESRKWVRYNQGDLRIQASPEFVSTIKRHFDSANPTALNARPLKTVLDLGAGNGFESEHLLAVHSAVKVTAIDWDAAALQRLNRRLPLPAQARLSTQSGHVVEVEFGSGIDLIVAQRLFAHLSDVQVKQVLAKTSKALSPSGLLVCDFFTTEHLHVHSRNAHYRSQDQVMALVLENFEVIEQHHSAGLLRLTLKPRSKH